nr:ie-1 [Darna trima granulovirus]
MACPILNIIICYRENNDEYYTMEIEENASNYVDVNQIITIVHDSEEEYELTKKKRKHDDTYVKDSEIVDDEIYNANYKWLNRFKTTTFHMFICLTTGIKYIRNERFPSDVYIKLYHKLYGNAYEFVIKDCKFYITSTLINFNKHDFDIELPIKPVVKHVDMKTIASLIQLKIENGSTLKQKIIQVMINTLLIGVDTEEADFIMQQYKKDPDMTLNYSWKSENRKKNQCIEENNAQIYELFELLCKNTNIEYKFRIDHDLDHSKYINDFNCNVNQLKKPITGYTDYVSNVKMTTKDLALIMYLNVTKNLQNLKNIEGNENDVELFYMMSIDNDKSDLIFNMKIKNTNNQKYRLNCFKKNNVYVWINSIIYNKTSSFNLDSIINKYKHGVHHIITFNYMYNSLMNKLHCECVKLSIRYILSERPLNLICDDLKINPKLKYKCFMYY